MTSRPSLPDSPGLQPSSPRLFPTVGTNPWKGPGAIDEGYRVEDWTTDSRMAWARGEVVFSSGSGGFRGVRLARSRRGRRGGIARQHKRKESGGG